MDGFEKTAVGIVIAGCAVVLAILGVGIWGFIEFIQWVTSK